MSSNLDKAGIYMLKKAWSFCKFTAKGIENFATNNGKFGFIVTTIFCLFLLSSIKSCVQDATMSESEKIQKAEQQRIEREAKIVAEQEKAQQKIDRDNQQQREKAEEDIESIMLNTQRMNACDIATAQAIGVHRDKVTTSDEDGVWISQAAGYTFICSVKAFGGMELALMNGSRVVKELNFDYTASPQRGITIFFK